MNQSKSNVDLTGAVANNPTPTLILEGKWDLTWGDAKPTILSRSHNNALVVISERAGHSICNENHDAFFTTLHNLLVELPAIDTADRERYGATLEQWRSGRHRSLEYNVRNTNCGKSGSVILTEMFPEPRYEENARLPSLLRLGFVFYDVGRYEEALRQFGTLEIAANSRTDNGYAALAFISQGHVLDLLGRRDEAIASYQRILSSGVDGGWTMDQYGLDIEFVRYAIERLEAPFVRLENLWP